MQSCILPLAAEADRRAEDMATGANPAAAAAARKFRRVVMVDRDTA